MSYGVDEVEAAVDPVVNDVAPVETALILEVLLKLVIYVLDHLLEAKNTVGTGLNSYFLLQ